LPATELFGILWRTLLSQPGALPIIVDGEVIGSTKSRPRGDQVKLEAIAWSHGQSSLFPKSTPPLEVKHAYGDLSLPHTRSLIASTAPAGDHIPRMLIPATLSQYVSTT
jgi:hypothetical protein